MDLEIGMVVAILHLILKVGIIPRGKSHIQVCSLGKLKYAKNWPSTE
jgi:hypothetical protein